MDTALGLLFLAVYIVAILSLAAGITWATIKIFPTERKPKNGDEPAKPARASAAPNGGASGAGSLFRRAKRGKS